MEYMCGYQCLVSLDEMVPLQGDLKNRKQSHVDRIAESLLEYGLLQPIMLWPHDEKCFILDGHGRYEALKQMGWAEPVPSVLVMAESEDEARSKLLEMNVKYGAITPKSLAKFLKGAPSVQVPVSLGIKVPAAAPKVAKAGSAGKVVRLRVAEEKLESFMEIMGTLSYVEIV
jgi:hypothetical protein